MSTIFAFLDTNIFMHYQPIEQINWTEVLESKTVTLTVAPVVIRELDKHKDQHRLSPMRDRARNALKKIRSVVLGTPSLNLPEGITLLCVDEPIIDFSENSLNRDISDDHLIASCLTLRDANPDAEVILVTHDTGPMIKAAQRGIKVNELPERYKLPSALDETEKKLRQLQQRIVQLENQSPQLQFGFSNGSQHIKVTLPALFTLTNEEIEQKLSEVKKKYPTLSLEPTDKGIPDELAFSGFSQIASVAQELARLNQPSPEAIRRYNDGLDTYFHDYETYLKEHATYENIQRLTIRLDTYLFNHGTAPAEDIDVFMHFPDGFILCEEHERPRLPKEPRPPRTPRGRFDFDLSLGGISTIASLPHFPPSISHLPSQGGNISSPTIKKSNSYDVSYGVRRLKQHLDAPCDPLYIFFHDKASSFGIDYRINAANLPNEVEGKLHVIVSQESPNEE